SFSKSLGNFLPAIKHNGAARLRPTPAHPQRGGVDARRFILLCLAILLAGTKFRSRDADASLSGQFDTQVLMELALYGGVLAALMLPRIRRHRMGLANRPTDLLRLYVIAAALSVTWSAAPMLTMVRVGQLITLLCLAEAMVSELGSEGAINAFASALIPFVSACVVAAVLVPSASDPELFTEGDFTRFAWFAVHPITAATHLGLALILLTHARLKRGT